jgi:hypothetical protein
MSREIKFRVWDGTAMVRPAYIDIHGQWYRGEAAIEAAEVEISQLMQFTGLKDKNGVDVFEGDIVRYQCESLGTKWDDTYAIGWKWGHFTFGPFIFYANIPGVISDEKNQPRLEILGNIYQNPELLENSVTAQKA